MPTPHLLFLSLSHSFEILASGLFFSTPLVIRSRHDAEIVGSVILWGHDVELAGVVIGSRYDTEVVRVMILRRQDTELTRGVSRSRYDAEVVRVVIL